MTPAPRPRARAASPPPRLQSVTSITDSAPNQKKGSPGTARRNTAMQRTHRKILASATIAAALTLTACSSEETGAPADGPNHGGSPAHGGDTEQTPTFDYSMPELGPVTVHEMRFELPQVVLDSEPDYEEGKMFSSISIKPMQLDTPGVCGIEMNRELHNDPVERLTQRLLADNRRLPTLRTDWGDDDKPPTPEEAREFAVDVVAGQKRKPESALDLADPEPGRYVSDDFTNVKVIGSCASSVDSDDALAPVSYRMVGQRPAVDSGDPYDTFASAEVGIFTNGDIFVTGAEIDGWELDINGDWIPS